MTPQPWDDSNPRSLYHDFGGQFTDYPLDEPLPADRDGEGVLRAVGSALILAAFIAVGVVLLLAGPGAFVGVAK